MKKIKVFFCLFICMIAFLHITDCSAKTIYEFNEKTISGYEGEKRYFKQDLAINKCKWKSFNKKVASVNKKGVVLFKKKGTTWIECRYKHKKYKWKVIVKQPYIKLVKKKINIGESIKCELIGGNVKKWSVDNNDFASIDKYGKLTGKKVGKVVVSAKTFGNKTYSREIEIDNLQSSQGMLNNKKLLSHRGYNIEAPENTMSAFKKSYEYGYKYVETDVTFTKDGIPVLLHDDTIDRTSNGTGKICNLTFDEVRQLDFGSWKNLIYKDEKIPTFDEFIEYCSTHDLHPYIELKSNISSEKVKILFEILDKYKMRKNVSWVSFNVEYVQYVKKIDESENIGINVVSVDKETISIMDTLKTPANTVFLSIEKHGINNDVINICKEKNIPISVWNCDTREEIFQLDSYISMVSTNSVRVD